MEKLIYLTTNPNKVNEANEFFSKKYGFNIEIVNPNFEILEIQASTCKEVAAFSAEYAANKLKTAVLKSDTGLYIDALGGLPGPYNHYFDKQIGIEKFLVEKTVDSLNGINDYDDLSKEDIDKLITAFQSIE